MELCFHAMKNKGIVTSQEQVCAAKVVHGMDPTRRQKQITKRNLYLQQKEKAERERREREKAQTVGLKVGFGFMAALFENAKTLRSQLAMLATKDKMEELTETFGASTLESVDAVKFRHINASIGYPLTERDIEKIKM